jgi:CheY-like chemotaxis protein
MASLLLVDDDEDTLGAMADVLASEGHEVRVAHDGLEGLDRVTQGAFDLICLDIEMPRLTGPQMAHELYLRDAGNEKIPIVLLSGNLDLPEVARTVGTPYFLPKPCMVDALVALVGRALTQRACPRPPADVAHASR